MATTSINRAYERPDFFQKAPWKYYLYDVAQRELGESKPRKVAVLCPIPEAAEYGTGAMEDEIVRRKKVNPSEESFQQVANRKNVSLKDLAVFYSVMSKNLHAGVSTVDAMKRSLLSVKQPYFRGVIACVIYFTTLEGKTTSTYMKRFSNAFGPLAIALMEAGEASDTIPEVFARLALDTNDELKRKKRLLGVFAYPIIIITVLSGILTMMQLFLLPKLLPAFKQMLPSGLPASTQMVANASEFAHDRWYVLVAAAVTLVALIAKRDLVLNKPGFQKFSIKIPIFGRLIQLVVLIRSLRAFSAMLRVGVPTERVYALISRVAGNVTYADYYKAIFKRLGTGIEPDVAFFKERIRIGNDGLDIAQAMKNGQADGEPWKSIDELVGQLEAESSGMLDLLPMLFNVGTLLGFTPILVTLALAIVEPSLKMGDDLTSQALGSSQTTEQTLKDVSR